MSHWHNTNICINLKYAIEILIQDEHLKQYNKKESVHEEA